MTSAEENAIGIDNNFSDVEVMDTPDKSESDNKSYRLIRLKNGLTVLLMFEPVASRQNEPESASQEIDENVEPPPDEEGCGPECDGDNICERLSGCSLCVDVGSYSDPHDIQGLAHFVEHMIMMGSEKYPKENEYNQYILKAGGFHNAETNLNETIFYLEVREECLDGALDRFSWLFKAPLMQKEAMSREREAVESEFQSKITGDGPRCQQLFRMLAEPLHPASKFVWGNLKTLKDNIDDGSLYERAHEFQRRHYSAHRMYMCMQSTLSLDQQQELVVKHFSDIPNNELPGDDFSMYNSENTFQPKFYEKVYFVKSIGQIYDLQITWCMEPSKEPYKTKPFGYVEHILTDQGKDSLLNYLRKNLWATEINVDTPNYDDSIFSLFAINVGLTEEGFKHLDDVLEATFSFLQYLHRSGPNERYYGEIQSLTETSFRFKKLYSAVDNCYFNVKNLKLFPPKHILTGNSLYFEYDADAIQDLLNHLNRRKFNIMVTSNCPYDDDVTYDSKEEWCGVEYSERPVPEKWITLWGSPRTFDELHIPEPNPYIADDFTILYDGSQDVPKYPVKIMDTDMCELWYRPDDKFLLPHAWLDFCFTTPKAFTSAENAVFFCLHRDLLMHYLAEELYPAEAAGVMYTCYIEDRGIVLHADGYVQKIDIVVNTLIECFKTLCDKITEKEFNVLLQVQIEGVERSFTNIDGYNWQLTLDVLKRQHFPLYEQYRCLKNITFESFQEYCRSYYSEVKIQALMQGNLTEEKAISIMENVLSIYDGRPIMDMSALKLCANKLPAGSTYLRCKSFVRDDVNTIIENFYQIGDASLRTQVLIELLKLVASEPLFDTLRTKEQLGYSVAINILDCHGYWTYSISVKFQENKFSTDYVDKRIENFRVQLGAIIEQLSDEELADFKSAYKQTLLTEDSSLMDECHRNFSEIYEEKYCFDRRERHVEVLKSIAKEDLFTFWQEHLGDNERKLSIQVIGTANRNGESLQDFSDFMCVEFDEEDTGNLIRDLIEFRESLETYPIAETTI